MQQGNHTFVFDQIPVAAILFLCEDEVFDVEVQKE
jgi:hypothetical protein